ncbi:MAG: diaminopimelate decarboxylase [Candidatus Thermoplasmatota archaeon]|nr:diaminopimelate decarboxylase [Candidatus Thermoplasmatota archaeon]
MPGYFSKNTDGLKIDGVPAEEIAEEYGTPVYVYSEDRIRDNYRRLRDALKERYEKVRILFSAKSNTNLSILNILKDEGANIDTVSVGEIFLAKKAGFDPDEILFTGMNLGDDEIDHLLGSDVKINVNSLSMLDRLLEKEVPSSISFRVNLQKGAGAHRHLITAGKNSKFGILEDDIIKAYRKALDSGVKNFGIHTHIGSGILDTDHHRRATEKLMDIAGKVKEKLGIGFEFIDIGGGIGIPYEPGEEEMDLEKFSRDVLTAFKEKSAEHGLGDPYFCMEPGRYIIGDAGIILTEVNTVKKTVSRKLAGIDAGLHTFIRPAMYDAYHHMIHAEKSKGNVETEKYDIMGPLCESSDFLGKERELPEIQEGDMLAICDTGAYGFTMSSNYNSMIRPPEVLVSGDSHTAIRESEDFEDLEKKQKIAEWLG